MTGPTDTPDDGAFAGDEVAADGEPQPIVELYDGDATVLVVLPLEESEGLAVLSLDPTSPDETVITEYPDLDTALEDNAERIDALLAASPVFTVGATAEQVWNDAAMLISPGLDPLIVVRTASGGFQVLDPVETEDGRPGDRGAFDDLIDAVWAGIEIVFGPEDDEDDDESEGADEGDEPETGGGEAPSADAGEVPPG